MNLGYKERRLKPPSEETMGKHMSDDNFTTPKPIDLDAGRRSFVQALGVTGVGAAVFAAAEGLAINEADAQQINDVNILNFALNLEYLEATFYLYAVTGAGLAAADRGANPGTVTGGRQVPFVNPIVKAYAAQIAGEERLHVQFLRSALGSSAAVMPNLDIQNAFTTAARAAGIINADPASNSSFDPYANDTNFLLASYIFEDVGVTAYNGASTLISNPTYLTAAASILAVEAYHSGIIRSSLFAMQNTTVVNATLAISQLRSSLANNGNANVDDYGIGTTASPHLVLSGPGGVAFARTTSQVLNIVYGRQNAPGTGGLFFPTGMTGVIR